MDEFQEFASATLDLSDYFSLFELDVELKPVTNFTLRKIEKKFLNLVFVTTTFRNNTRTNNHNCEKSHTINEHNCKLTFLFISKHRYLFDLV